MTTDFVTAKLALYREEIVPRLTDAVATLDGIAAGKQDAAEVARVLAKRDAVQKIIDEQGERLTAVQDEDTLARLIDFINGVARLDHADEEGTKLAIGYIMGYLR